MDSFNVGERLKELRLLTGLTQRELALRAGVPHSQISMVEHNKNSPSVATLRKILGGIPTTMADFFSPDSGNHSSKTFYTPSELLDLTARLYEHKTTSRRINILQVGDARAHNLQILQETYEPGADTGDAMLEHHASEGGIVIEGEIEITIGEEISVLKAGDAYLFDSRKPHRFRNTSPQPAKIISACTPPYL